MPTENKPVLVQLHNKSGAVIVVEHGSAAEANARAAGYKDASFLTTDAAVDEAKALQASQEAEAKAATDAEKAKTKRGA